MKDNLAAAVVKFVAFAAVCLVGVVALLAIFAQLRFGSDKVYRAHFANTSGLKTGDFVRIAGVEVGKVDKITMHHDGTLDVEFGTDDSVVLTQGSRAVVRWDNLIGDRYLGLEDGPGDTRTLPVGATIPLERTAPALDLDSLIGGFRPLFRALNPEQVNSLTADLISAFQGEGETIGSLLSQTASVTNTLADRDQLIGQVITNLNTVLGSLSNESEQFDKAVTSLSELVDALAGRKTEIASSLRGLNDASATVADLLVAARPPLQEVLTETDRTAGIVLADHEYVDNLLATLPDKYRILGREGLYGDYFGFYLCDVSLKLNGKGGQPVIVKAASQTTGRCAPK